MASSISPTKNNEIDYISCDAPPLDFSFKNITHLQELLQVEPRKGQKKVANHEHSETEHASSGLGQQSNSNPVFNKMEEEGSWQQAQGHQHSKTQESQAKQEKSEEQEQHGGGSPSADQSHKKSHPSHPAPVIKLLPENNLNSVVSQMINTSAMKNISSKAKEELEKKKKKAINVKLLCCSLMLGYNKLRELRAFPQVVPSVMESFQQLQWVDLSHNYLETLDYGFPEQDLPHLRTLYLHCNYLHSLENLNTRLKDLRELKTFTIHGNCLTEVANFRLLVISILPQLRKLDSVLVSKKERDNAVFIRSQLKKLPQPKTIIRPPQEKQLEEEDEDHQAVL